MKHKVFKKKKHKVSRLENALQQTTVISAATMVANIFVENYH